MSSAVEKESLLQAGSHSSFETDLSKESWDTPHTRRSRLYKELHITALYVVIGILSFALSFSPFIHSSKGSFPELIYSPAASALSYEIREFEPAFFVANDYMGYPNERNNRLWEDLYSFGISGITPSEADKLANKTIPVKLVDGSITHLIQLDVFHQLHCLNSLRQSLYEKEFPLWEYDENGKKRYDTISVRHWDHCLDALRQTLMCHGDVSPVVFHYNRTSRGSFPKLNAVHTCRNWDQIVGWAKNRQAIDYEIIPPAGEKSVGDIGIEIDDA